MRALLLLLILVCGISSAAPSPAENKQPPANEKKEQAKDEKPKTEVAPTLPVIQIRNEVTSYRGEQTTAKENKRPDEVLAWRATVATAGIAFLALLVAGAQVWFFKDQLGKMERSLADSKTMAEAARNQSESIMHAERAYVKISHLKPGLRKVSEQSSEVKVKVRNMGRTPAEVTDVHIDFAFTRYEDPLPKPYPFRNITRESFPNGLLMPNEWLHHSRTVSSEQALAPGKQLWFFGEVDYIDVFGRRWRGGYARKYWDHKDDNLYNNTEDRDNFDRERLPDEGRDWDEESKAAFFARKGKLPS